MVLRRPQCLSLPGSFTQLRRTNKTTLVWSFAYLVILLVCRAPALMGQTLFQWPVEQSDVSQYLTIDECMAAGIRVRDSAKTATPLWLDTLLFSDATMRTPLPDNVVATARRCMARFDIETIPVRGAHYWLQLYLLSGQLGEGRRIVERRFEVIDSADLLQQVAVADTFIRTYFAGQPIRGDEATALIPRLQRIEQMPGRPAVRLLRTLTNYFQWAFEAGDSIHARHGAELVKRLEATISSEERIQGRYMPGDAARSFFALLYLRRTELLDSLGVSTQGYLALRRQIWGELTGTSGDLFPDRVGERAVPIEGNFWFQSGRDSHEGTLPHQIRPTPGKAAIIVFFRQDVCARNTRRCSIHYAALRRLARQFPEAEVTFVAQTLGYFSEDRPLDPEHEAKQLRMLWLEYHQLPGMLAVTTTSFFRLPAPDRRRINDVTENVANYTFGRPIPFDILQVLIVDANGVIVMDDEIQDVKEREAAEILRIVTRRKGTVGEER